VRDRYSSSTSSGALLALRPNPELRLKPEVDRVRGDLARLLGEHLKP
jgi:hypothetical protein